MQKLKELLIISSVTVILAFTCSYFIGTFLAKKINEEAIQVEFLVYNINHLKDLHQLCVLDYKINPNGKEILPQCKKLEDKILTLSNHIEEAAPYYKFYKTYFK